MEIDGEIIDHFNRRLTAIKAGDWSAYIAAYEECRNVRVNNMRDKNGRILLSHACEYGYSYFVKHALECSYNPNKKDNTGKTPLMYAAERNSLSAVSVLLKDRRVIVNLRDNQNKTAIFYANKNSKSDPLIAKLKQHAKEQRDFLSLCLYDNNVDGCFVDIGYLIEGGANVNYHKSRDYYPMHAMATEGDLTACELLVRHGALVDCRDNQKRTPLMHAAENGCSDVFEFLLNAGADPKITDNYGATVADYVDSFLQDVVVNVRIGKQVIGRMKKIGKFFNKGKHPFVASFVELVKTDAD